MCDLMISKRLPLEGGVGESGSRLQPSISLFEPSAIAHAVRELQTKVRVCVLHVFRTRNFRFPSPHWPWNLFIADVNLQI